MMIKKYSLILMLGFLAISMVGKAQTPLTQVVDFLVKDIHGQQHQLFDILDNQQKYVFTDFFSVTCGPCQAIAPKLDTVYHLFGANESDLYVMAIDQNFNNEMVAEFEEEYGTHYPAISGIEGSGGQVYEDYQIPYYPSLILIAPDHSIVEQAIEVPASAQDLIDVLESHGIHQVLGVEDDFSEQKANLSFYPNPASDVLNVHVTTPVKSIKIFELTGKMIWAENMFNSKNEVAVDISSFQKGIYLLSVEMFNGERISKTFVKK